MTRYNLCFNCTLEGHRASECTNPTNRRNYQNGPPKRTGGMGSASLFPNSASPKTEGNHLDPGAPGCLQTAITETPFFA